MNNIDVIIPTYRPGHKFIELLERLHRQTMRPDHSIVINTGREYYDQLVYGMNLAKEYPELEVHHIEKNAFDHAATRNEAVRSYSHADVFIMMTQDAVPSDRYLVERIKKASEDEGVAVAYARQLAGRKASPAEKYTRHFNYPAVSAVRTKQDKEIYGIKTYFCSNVCAAYNRDIFDRIGGFSAPAIFNEDMIFAANAINDGYAVAYAADAKVYHSHDYTGAQQFHRNFDLAVSQAQHPEIFEGVGSEHEGIRFAKDTLKYLCKYGYARYEIPFIWRCMCRYAGYLLGKRYRILPKDMIMKCTMNKTYWENNR